MERAIFQRLALNPVEFRKAINIDTGDGPRPLHEVMEPWQRKDFLAIDPAMRRLTGQDVKKQCPARMWLERGRGHAKTSDLAVIAAWALFASQRRLSGIAAAGDRDQADLLRDAIGRLVFLNPWLAEFITVQRDQIINPHTGSTLTFLSSDAATSYGLTPDFVIADELTHWKSEQFWTSIFSSTAKRPNCVLVVISNAGMGRGKSWQWHVREAAATSDRWHFSRLDGPKASWIDEATLDEQAKLLPPSAFRRLWLNEWCDESGDALDPEDLQAARTLPGPTLLAESGWMHAAGLDIGLKRDASALVVVRCRPLGRIQVAQVKLWKPTGRMAVNLEEVESALLDAHWRYRLSAVYYDPWQAAHLAQRATARGLPMHEFPFTAENLKHSASAFLSAFRERRIDLYDDSTLIHDLESATIRERPGGGAFRVEFPRDSHGHGDAGTALLLALPACLATAVSEPEEEINDGLGSNILQWIARRDRMEQQVASFHFPL